MSDPETPETNIATGPLTGIRVLEFAGMGPGPFAGMMLSDMGADIVRVDRPPDEPSVGRPLPDNPIHRGRRSIALDLRKRPAVSVALRLVERCDVLLEGYRPGTMERLGLGPDECLRVNPRLVYGRMTGWGQQGPYAQRAGHDINYIAVAGALEPIGRAGGPPVPPLNLLGDYGGGGMYLAYGVVCALLEAQRSGIGQVIDAAMVDGVASLTTSLRWQVAAGRWPGGRGENRLDSGAPFYDVYQTADGRYVSIGALEPRFYRGLCEVLDLTGELWRNQDDRSRWPRMRQVLTELFASRTRAEWCAVFDAAGVDACFAPVVAVDEAPLDEHNFARGSFVSRDGVSFVGPVPRLSRTPGRLGAPPALVGQHSREVLADFGFDAAEVDLLEATGSVR